MHGKRPGYLRLCMCAWQKVSTRNLMPAITTIPEGLRQLFAWLPLMEMTIHTQILTGCLFYEKILLPFHRHCRVIQMAMPSLEVLRPKYCGCSLALMKHLLI